MYNKFKIWFNIPKVCTKGSWVLDQLTIIVVLILLAIEVLVR